MTSERRELLAAARAAAEAARDLLRTARPHEIRSKSNARDLVTEWDLRAEDTIRTVLAQRTPGVPVLGEEGGLDTAGGYAGELRWLVDPIDGTVNFAHGLPIWCVSIAVEELAAEDDDQRFGRTLAGVVVAPALDWWFEASAGGGARDGAGRPLGVSGTRDLADALLSTGFPYDRATNPDNNLAAFCHLKRRATVRRLGAAALDLCLVAQGALDGYWETRLQPWDLAAGGLIVAEAGGTVTDTRGGRFDPHKGEAIATNGAIHEALISALRTVEEI